MLDLIFFVMGLLKIGGRFVYQKVFSEVKRQNWVKGHEVKMLNRINELVLTK